MHKRHIDYDLKTMFLLVSLALGGWSCVYTSAFKPERSGSVVRVTLMQDARDVQLETRGRYEIQDPALGRTLVEGRRLAPIRAFVLKNEIHIGEHIFPLHRIRIHAPREISVYINDRERRFRGDIDLIQNKENTLLVVNRLDIEDYIRGVLYHEVSHRWPLEAIKAQAVAARTYALYQKSVNAAREYDLTNDIYSQVYGGRTSEKYRTNLAVERTRDEVLTFQGRVIPAYFHATCGGNTEDVSQLWKHDPIRPLQGTSCTFCTHSPHYRWEKAMALNDIRKRLNDRGLSVGPIKDIRIVERNASGRIKNLQFLSVDGKITIVSGKDFRDMLGPNLVRSNNYRVAINGNEAVFSGRGWGHGVGLCQWGAQKMAEQRYDYRSILKKYYPGTVIERYPY